MKITVSALCGGQHEHQQVTGANKFGARSIQKAEWPKKMCRMFLRVIDAELYDRTCARSFPAETSREVAEEFGSIDDPDEAA